MAEKSYNSIITETASGSVTIGPNWMQGRAGFGGLVAAIAAEHMQQSVKTNRPLRSFMVSFVAPTPTSALTVDTTLLREGGNVSQASTAVTSADGQVCLQAMGAFGTARETRVSLDHGLPLKAENRESFPPVPKRDSSVKGHFPPIFLNNFAIHWTGGGFPMSGTNSRRVGMWVRHEESPQGRPASALMALADIPPAAVMSHYTTPMLISSLTWSLEFVQPVCDLRADQWFYLDYSADAAQNGYSQQSGTIHAEDGTLVALSRQCMCYFD